MEISIVRIEDFCPSYQVNTSSKTLPPNQRFGRASKKPPTVGRIRYSPGRVQLHGRDMLSFGSCPPLRKHGMQFHPGRFFVILRIRSCAALAVTFEMKSGYFLLPVRNFRRRAYYLQQLSLRLRRCHNLFPLLIPPPSHPAVHFIFHRHDVLDPDRPEQLWKPQGWPYPSMSKVRMLSPTQQKSPAGRTFLPTREGFQSCTIRRAPPFVHYPSCGLSCTHLL